MFLSKITAVVTIIALTNPFAPYLGEVNDAKPETPKLNPSGFIELIKTEDNETHIDFYSVSETIKDVVKCRENQTTLKLLTERRDFIEKKYKETELNFRMHTSYKPIKESKEALKGCLDKANDMIDEFLKTNHLLPTRIIPLQNHEIYKTTDYLSEMQNIVYAANAVNTEVDWFYGFYDLNPLRKTIVETAMSLENKITYEWGGKPQNPGWNTRWDASEEAGLDCSGFVEWVYWTVMGSSNEQLRSTLTITANQKEITHDELRPGDLGTKFKEGTYYTNYKGDKFHSFEQALQSNKRAGYGEEEVTTCSNHVGIYVGKDVYGNDIWCHCQGGDVRTVTIGTFKDFTCYYRMPGIE